MTPKPLSPVFPLIMLGTIALLGAVMWMREPQGGAAFAIAIFLLPIAWAFIEWRHRGSETSDPADIEELSTVRYSILGAGLMIAVPLAITLAISLGLTGSLSDEVERRGMGIVFGIVFLLYGNNVPKRPVTLSRKGCSPGAIQAQTRFAGRTFMLTALVYTLIWLFAPIAWALPASMIVLIGGVGLVMLRAFQLHRNKR